MNSNDCGLSLSQTNAQHGHQNMDWHRIGLLSIILLWCFGAGSFNEVEDATAAAGSDFCSRPNLPVSQPIKPFKVALGISSVNITKGKKVKIRVENLGTEPVAYGFEYRLSHFEDGEWVATPTGPMFTPVRYVAGGRAGECQTITVAKSALAGTYRVLKEVSMFEGKKERTKTVRAFFKVE